MSDERSQVVANLARIADRWRDCRCCPLHATRSNVVMWRGNPLARLVVVGEAPGANEDEEGKPFVGRAGRLFDDLCGSVIPYGPEPWSYFLANTIGCRPPNNRKPTREEWRACYPRLFAMLGVVQPKVVLLLGSTALEFLVGWHGIEKNRKKWMRVEYEWRRRTIVVPALATYHPAYLLRDPSVTKQTVADIRMAWEKAQPGSWVEGD